MLAHPDGQDCPAGYARGAGIYPPLMWHTMQATWLSSQLRELL